MKLLFSLIVPIFTVGCLERGSDSPEYKVKSPIEQRRKCIETEKIEAKGKTKMRVFVDGIFDLPHLGHQIFILAAMEKGADVLKVPVEDIEMLVGVSGTPEEIENYKRKSVYSFSEKKQELCGFLGVYRVVNSLMVTTTKFIEQYEIDLVIAGGDYADAQKARNYYADAMDRNVFYTVDRDLVLGTSTSDLMRRTVERMAALIKGKVQDSDKKVVDRFLVLVQNNF